MNHQEIEALKQQLIELHYGLLDEREAQELRDRIASSVEVAELWLEAQGFAGKIQQATRSVPTEIEKTGLHGASTPRKCFGASRR